jgi:hypothetical protein
VKRVFGFEGRRKLKFLLDNLRYRPWISNRQGIAEKVVQQLELFVLSGAICVDGFHVVSTRHSGDGSKAARAS